MRKKILVAEAADPVRSVAETVLRQNGFEVISVSNAERAREVLQYARPDMVIVGADLCTRDQHPLYEKIQSDPRTATVPILLFASETGLDVPFPQEVIIARPLDVRDLLQRVAALSTASAAGAARAGSGPLGGTTIDDEFLDEALGLDKIDVTASEVLDRTTAASSTGPLPKPNEKHGNIAPHNRDAEEMSDSSRVESLIIQDEHAEIARTSSPSKKPAPPASSGSSKLEIMSDQYGLTDPNAFAVQHRDDTHDYDWFIRSMTEENQTPDFTTPGPSAAKTVSDSS